MLTFGAFYTHVEAHTRCECTPADPIHWGIVDSGPSPPKEPLTFGSTQSRSQLDVRRFSFDGRFSKANFKYSAEGWTTSVWSLESGGAGGGLGGQEGKLVDVATMRCCGASRRADGRPT